MAAGSSTLPNKETVTLKLPSGEMVDAVVPAGMSDGDIRSLMSLKRPDLISPKGLPNVASPKNPQNPINKQELKNPASPNFRGGEMPGMTEGANLAEPLAGWTSDVAHGIGGGAKDIAQGNIARGAHRMIGGVGTASLPAVSLIAPVAPMATGRAIAGGMVAGRLAEKGASAIGATPDQAALVGDVGNIVGGGVATQPPMKLVGGAARAISGVVEPDVAGIFSPRLGNALRVARRLGEATSSESSLPPIADLQQAWKARGGVLASERPGTHTRIGSPSPVAGGIERAPRVSPGAAPPVGETLRIPPKPPRPLPAWKRAAQAEAPAAEPPKVATPSAVPEQTPTATGTKVATPTAVESDVEFALRRPPKPADVAMPNQVPPEQRASTIIPKEANEEMGARIAKTGETKANIEKGETPKVATPAEPKKELPSIYTNTEPIRVKRTPYVWERKSLGRGEALDDQGVSQSLQEDLASHEAKANKEMMQEFAARNSMDVPKYIRQQRAKIATPSQSEDLTPILQKSVEKVKAEKASASEPRPAVGSRVRVTSSLGGLPKGKEGTVTTWYKGEPEVRVQFDDGTSEVIHHESLKPAKKR